MPQNDLKGFKMLQNIPNPLTVVFDGSSNIMFVDVAPSPEDFCVCGNCCQMRTKQESVCCRSTKYIRTGGRAIMI